MVEGEGGLFCHPCYTKDRQVAKKKQQPLDFKSVPGSLQVARSWRHVSNQGRCRKLSEVWRGCLPCGEGSHSSCHRQPFQQLAVLTAIDMFRWQAGSMCTTLDVSPASTVTSCSTLGPWLMLLMERCVHHRYTLRHNHHHPQPQLHRESPGLCPSHSVRLSEQWTEYVR